MWPVVWSEKRVSTSAKNNSKSGTEAGAYRAGIARSGGVGAKSVLAYADSYRNMANHGVESIPVWSVITDLERNIAPLFTAPPAPVSVPDAMEMDDDFDSAFEHGKAVGWNACRAAMLQGADGKSPVIPDGWVIVPAEPTAEMLSLESQHITSATKYRFMTGLRRGRWNVRMWPCSQQHRSRR
jgi:hypothetical protein